LPEHQRIALDRSSVILKPVDETNKHFLFAENKETKQLTGSSKQF
jgi:hypothetical protein